MALDAAWGNVDGLLTTAGLPSSPPWKRQARERVAAELQAAKQRKDERAAAGQKLCEWRAALGPQMRAANHVRHVFCSSGLEEQWDPA